MGAQGKRGTNEESDTADRATEVATQVLIPAPEVVLRPQVLC